MICHTHLRTRFYPNLSFTKFVPHENLTLPHLYKLHAHARTHTQYKNAGVRIHETIILDHGYLTCVAGTLRLSSNLYVILAVRTQKTTTDYAFSVP